MQPPTDGPRAGYTTAQVTYLVQNSSSIDTDMGMELLDQDLNVLADISDNIRAATVSRNSYANIHASLSFTIDAPLDWGSAIVRPYMTITGQTAVDSALTTMQFYLGAYVTDTPQENLADDISSFDPTGYDILSLLDDPVGDAYSVDVGVQPLSIVENILLNRGFSKYVIDQDRAASVLTSPKTYTMDDNVTWLTVVNDLLATVGYAGIYSDWNGVLRAQVYRSPATRGPEWSMTDDTATTLLTQRRARQWDFYDTPNHWVFYRSSSTDSDQPSATNGMRYEYTNQTAGLASVEARGGRIKTKVVGVDAVDAASLQSTAQVTIDADMLIPEIIPIETAPFPLGWHFDRFAVSDAQLGHALQVVATQWSLNLDGSDMTWEWTGL